MATMWILLMSLPYGLCIPDHLGAIYIIGPATTNQLVIHTTGCH